MNNFVRTIDKILSGFLIFLMGSIVLVVTWQVITRFLMEQPSSYTEELARFLLIWIGLLGASWAVRTQAHLGIDLLTEKLSDSGNRKLKVTVNTIIGLFAFFIMVVGGMKLVNLTFQLNQISAAIGIKMGYIYTVLPLSGLLIILYSIVAIFELFRDDLQTGGEG